jgi:hypothetical protein
MYIILLTSHYFQALLACYIVWMIMYI